MGAPRLENQTGTFANSVRITDISATPQGFPSIGYTYQRQPYGFIEDNRFVEPPNVYRAERLWGSRRPGMTSKGWSDSEPDTTFTKKAVQYLSLIHI